MTGREESSIDTVPRHWCQSVLKCIGLLLPDARHRIISAGGSIDRHAELDQLELLVDELESTLPDIGRLVVMRYFWQCNPSQIRELTGLAESNLESKLSLGTLWINKRMTTSLEPD